LGREDSNLRIPAKVAGTWRLPLPRLEMARVLGSLVGQSEPRTSGALAAQMERLRRPPKLSLRNLGGPARED